MRAFSQLENITVATGVAIDRNVDLITMGTSSSQVWSEYRNLGFYGQLYIHFAAVLLLYILSFPSPSNITLPMWITGGSISYEKINKGKNTNSLSIYITDY